MKTSPPSSSIEDYVKVIYSFTEWQDKPITSTQLAQRLGVANSSVSEMVRKLKDQGLVDHQPYSAITLTADGVRLALSMVRRHRLIETFLVRELGYRWDEVHDEAELLEHAVSDTFIERMAAKLGNPVRDPHGDPIPAADGSVRVPAAHRMSELDDGHTGRITRISDENPELLRYLSAEEIDLDADVEVLGRKPFGGALVVRIGSGAARREFDLAEEVASALWVHSEAAHRRLQRRAPLNAGTPDAPTPRHAGLAGLGRRRRRRTDRNGTALRRRPGVPRDGGRGPLDHPGDQRRRKFCPRDPHHGLDRAAQDRLLAAGRPRPRAAGFLHHLLGGGVRHRPAVSAAASMPAGWPTWGSRWSWASAPRPPAGKPARPWPT